MISGSVDETEFEYTNNKHSLDVSGCKKLRYLNFWKFAALFQNLFDKKQLFTFNEIDLTD